jgi:hypothetical protein
MIEAMKLALEALKNSVDSVSNEAREAESLYGKYPSRLARVQGLVALEVAHQTAIKALEEALAKQEQKPVAWMDADGNVSDNNDHKCFPIPLYTHPPQRMEQEPVIMWPCHIIEADFHERTITLGMECGDYKVSAGTHWLSTHPPQRTEQEPVADDFFKMIADKNPKPFPLPQRTWVGLTDEDVNGFVEQFWDNDNMTMRSMMRAIEAKLKQKNMENT